ncbi:DMT family transporter [Rhodococcus sp. TAF43]|uniref:DMT family transporter n=1 Tax=unclassified Rhodococcus (in: high G+C Gram-positive bacteria) TaxID=192944 RepID=UPI0015830C6D|nr:DMT family transporter [Rhodococcus sp. W8901]QKT09664.1 DMT family transporter [Rhodococcus sp. W8901]
MSRGPGAAVNAGSRSLGTGAWAAGLASAAAYGLTPVVAVLAYHDGVSPSVLVTLRGVCGSVVLLLIAAGTGRLRGISRRPAAALLFLCGPLFGVQILAYFAAVQATGAQVALALVHIYPLFVLLLVWLARRQRVNVWTVALCVPMLCGIGLVAGGGAASSSITVIGVGAALLSASGYAVYLVLGEEWGRSVGVVNAALLVTVGATITTGIVAVATSQSFAVPQGVWHVAVVQGLLLNPVGIGCAFYAMRRLGSVAMSMIGLLEPIFGIVSAALVLGERLDPVQWLGVGFILSLGGLLPWTMSDRRRRPVASSGAVHAHQEVDRAGVVDGHESQ